jgi:hypothetical protein
MKNKKNEKKNENETRETPQSFALSLLAPSGRAKKEKSD